MLQDRINNTYSILSDSERHIVSTILNHQDEFEAMTIEKLSALCNTSTTSVFRTIKKLGFDGYSQFKFFMNHEHPDRVPRIQDHKREILENIRITLDSINESALNTFFDCLTHAPNRYAYGTGWKQASLLESFSDDLITVNKPLTLLHSVTDFKRTAEAMRAGDVMVIVSLTGNTDGIAEIVRYLTLKGVHTIAITSYTLNEIASASEINFYFKDDNVLPDTLPWPALTLKAIMDYMVYRFMLYDKQQVQ